jgi:NADH-quinone oxidoreductase subunit B
MPVPDRQAVPRAHTQRALEYLRQGDDSFLTTTVDAVFNWGRKYSMFLYPFVTACCGMEFMSVAGPRYDLDRFGTALPRFSPRQADLLMVVGTITHRQAPILKKVYDQMAEPKWVMAFGACTCSGGPYNNYAVVQGIDTIIPVDIYVPGCPPRPEAVLDGMMKLQARVQQERVPSDGRHKEIDELELPVIEKPIA